MNEKIKRHDHFCKGIKIYNVKNLPDVILNWQRMYIIMLKVSKVESDKTESQHFFEHSLSLCVYLLKCHIIALFYSSNLKGGESPLPPESKQSKHGN
jgi:hypothetical protein